MGVWYENVEYPKNPFSIRPDIKNFVGYRDIIKKVADGIASDDLIILKGPFGSGKTTMLQYIKSKIKKPLTPIYHVGTNKLDFDRLLEKKGGLLAQIFGSKKYTKQDNLVLLVDEAYLMPPSDLEKIKIKYDEGLFKSVIFATAKDIEEISPSLVDRAVILHMRSMTPEEAWEMIQRRLGDLPNILHKDSVRLIVEYCKGNPRKILKTCEYVLRETFARYVDIPTYILPQHVKEILNIEENKGEPEEKVEVKKIESEDEKEEATIGDIHFENSILDALSPLQKRIIVALKDSPKTYEEIAEEIHTGRSTIAKQVSRLTLSSDKEMLKKKGVLKALVEKYFENGLLMLKLTDYAKSLLRTEEVIIKDITPEIDFSKITVI